MERPLLVWRRTLRELRIACVDLLLPPHCPGCGAPASAVGTGPTLCRPCRVHLQTLAADAGPPEAGPVAAWPVDAGPVDGVPVDVGPGSPGALRADRSRPRGIVWAMAPFAYAGTGGALVRRLKFAGDFGAMTILAAAMAGTAANAPWLARHPVAVPVPLHRSRRRARGFDQAALLAGEVARRLGWQAAPGVLRRCRHTLPQGDPRVTSRIGNVDGAFACVRPRRVRGRAVVLVDDVTTSGATASACAAELRRAGCTGVALLTACRA